MKTHKTALEQAQQIRNGKYPDIGIEYHRVLSEAQNGHLKAHLADPKWLEVFTELPAQVKVLQEMGLIGPNLKLTKLGTTYQTNYGQPLRQRKRHG